MNKHLTGAFLLLVVALSGCASASPAAEKSQSTTATPTPTPTVSAMSTGTPSAGAVKMSGSFAADVTALGIKPDSMSAYTAYLKKRICGESGTGLGIAVRSIGGSTPASGGGQDVVRLTVAYFCPSKSAEVETALDYFK